jgi:flagellar biosynthesis protein FlhB
LLAKFSTLWIIVSKILHSLQNLARLENWLQNFGLQNLAHFGKSLAKFGTVCKIWHSLENCLQNFAQFLSANNSRSSMNYFSKYFVLLFILSEIYLVNLEYPIADVQPDSDSADGACDDRGFPGNDPRPRLHGAASLFSPRQRQTSP